MMLMNEPAMDKKLQAEASSILCQAFRSVDGDFLICYSCMVTAIGGMLGLSIIIRIPPSP